MIARGCEALREKASCPNLKQLFGRRFRPAVRREHRANAAIEDEPRIRG